MIKYCGCTKNSEGATNGAQFQDKKYSPGMRVFTVDKDGKASRCTVCGKHPQ